MTKWNLHEASEDNLILVYQCGLQAGQQLALRKDLVMTDPQGRPTGERIPKGEVWLVLPGIRSDPVLWLRQANGERHTWDDDAESVQEWFEVIESIPD